MGKQQIADRMRNTANFSSMAAAERALDAILDSVVEELTAGRHVLLRGFGVFKVKAVASRKGRNFATGKTVKIPAGKVARFEPGVQLQKSVKKSRKNSA